MTLHFRSIFGEDNLILQTHTRTHSHTRTRTLSYTRTKPWYLRWCQNTTGVGSRTGERDPGVGRGQGSTQN